MSTSTRPAPTVRGDDCKTAPSRARPLLLWQGLGLTAYFLLLITLVPRRSRGAIVVGDVLSFRRPRGIRSYRRSQRWRMPRVSTLRPVVLWGILVALFTSSWLQGEIFPGNGRFALCSRGNEQACVIDGDTIRYNGMTIRLEDIDAPETYEPRCPSELALGERATNRLIELINAGAFEVVYRGGHDEDRYGRKLRVIERDGRSLGDVLVAEGLARRWDGARRSWCG